MANQLFAKKSLKVLLDEMAGEHRLKRVLGPFTLSALGIGAIIGTGIFVMTGFAARNYAGPGLILSYVVAGLACAFAALCYAEFASMAPVAGSAYTYAYTTLGELMAWIIGWDLVLEYAMGSATVAAGWSKYFLDFLKLFKNQAGNALITIPAWLSMDPVTVGEQHADYLTAKYLVVASAKAKLLDAKTGDAQQDLPVDVHVVDEVEVRFTKDSLKVVEDLHGEKIIATTSIHRVKDALETALKYDAKKVPQELLDNSIVDGYSKGYHAYEDTPLVFGSFHLTFNLIAIVIVAIITMILVIGIRESAGFNSAMVVVKVAAVLFVIVAGYSYVKVENWTPFLPFGMSGVFGAAGVIFFAYIGFDSVSTHAEEAKNPSRDVPIGIISSLAICTVLYIAVTAVITGMVRYTDLSQDAPISNAFMQQNLNVAAGIITVGALTGITSVLLVMLLSQPRVLLAMARDGLLPEGFFGAVHPRFQTPHKSTILTGVASAVTASLFPLEALGHMVSIGTLFAFVVVCCAVWIMRHTNPDLPRPFKTPALPFVAAGGIIMCLTMMFYLGWLNWVRLFGWLAIGLCIYFGYSRRHSHLGKQLRGELAAHGISPAGMPADGIIPKDERIQ